MRKHTRYLAWLRGFGAMFPALALALALSLSLAAVTLPAHAQDTSLKQYEVELVIFRVTNPAGSPEDWALEEIRAKAIAPRTEDGEDAKPSGTQADTAATLVTTLSNESSIQPLESARYKLTPLEGTLKRSRSYQALAHVGWSQPGFGRESPRPLGIESLVPSGTGLSGSVSLTRGARLLHLQLDITYQAADGQRYVLREQRALRSGDKHYFDHPYFGVIAVVTPKGT